MIDTEAGRLEQPPNEPSAWAKRKARASLRQVRVLVLDRHPGDDDRVLGTFWWNRVHRISRLGQEYHEAERRIEIYRASFARMRPPDLRHQLAITIAHEFVHFLESFQAEAERSLALQEHGEQPTMTLEEARRRDRAFVIKRAAAWTLLGAAGAAPFVAWAVSVW